jgi:hypothetical protein
MKQYIYVYSVLKSATGPVSKIVESNQQLYIMEVEFWTNPINPTFGHQMILIINSAYKDCIIDYRTKCKSVIFCRAVRSRYWVPVT